MGAALLPLAIGGAGIAGGQYMKQQAAKSQQDQLAELARMGKFDGNGATSVNPILGRASPQMANSPQERIGRMAQTNPMVAEILAKKNLEVMMGGGGFSGILKPGETAFQNGRQVASLPAALDGPKAPTVQSFYDGGGREYKAQYNPTTGAWDRVGGVKQENSGTDESWGNPVTEIAPDGKPISVRYGSKGGRKIVEGATPARQGNSFDRQDYWRNTFKPELASATNTYAQSAKVKNSLALDSGLGDIAAINALQKQIDEGAVVRDQDVALVQSAQSLISSLESHMNGLENGNKLSPTLRKQLQETSDTLSNAIYSGVKQKIEPYSQTMKQEGVDITNIVPTSLQKAYGWDNTPDMSNPSYDFAAAALGNGWKYKGAR